MIKEVARSKVAKRHIETKAVRKLMLLRTLQENEIPVSDYHVIDDRKITPDMIVN